MFALYNNSNKSYLKLRSTGLWYCEDEKTAKDMAEAANEYLIALGLERMVDGIKVVEFSNESELQVQDSHFSSPSIQ